MPTAKHFLAYNLPAGLFLSLPVHHLYCLLALFFLNLAFIFNLATATPIISQPPSSIDCSFERTQENQELGGFCGWRPDSNKNNNHNDLEGSTAADSSIWHTGNAVLVDSVHSVVRSSSSGGDRFAFVQGRYGAPTEGSLRSPLVHDRLLLGGEQPQQQQQNRRLLRLTYWKASVSPSLDICLEEETGQPLRCVDSIQGPGQQQWVRRSVELPAEERPFRVVLKARNLLAAEDIIGVDDIQLLSANGENALENSPAIIGLTPLAPAKSGNNNNQHKVVLASVDSPADSAAVRSPKNPFEGLLADDENSLSFQNNNKDAEQQEGEQRTRIFAVPSDDNANDNRQNSNNKNKKKVSRDFASSSSPAEAKQQPQKQQQIRPQIRLSPSLQLDDVQQQQMAAAAMLGGSRNRFFDPSSSSSSSASLAQARRLFNGVAAGSGNSDPSPFPSMPSFGPASLFHVHTGAGAAAAGSPKAAAAAGVVERSERCRAVTCSFMDDTCLWDLGSGWHSTSHGSVSVESPATHSRLASAQFKPPVASYVDFELWMSDDADLTVAEQIMAEEGNNELQLFTRKGATDGGWHRFRVPLRPSFSPVRLLFLAQLSAPVNAFISLSNIRMVNSEGAEIGCQSLEEKSLEEKFGGVPGGSLGSNDRRLLADAGLDWLARQPTPLQIPAALGAAPFPAPPPFPAPNALLVPPQLLQSQDPSTGPAAAALASPTAAAFNPLKPMMEGILPIVPLRGNPPRLTAVMDEPPAAHRHRHNDFPQLLSPLAIESATSPAEKANFVAPEFGSIKPPDEQQVNKFELEQQQMQMGRPDENEDNKQQAQQQQQLYGATPIPMAKKGHATAEEEALLPFGTMMGGEAGGDFGETEMGGGEAFNNKQQLEQQQQQPQQQQQQQQQQRENAEVTLLPRRRSKLLAGGHRVNNNRIAEEKKQPQRQEEEDWPNLLEMGGSTAQSAAAGGFAADDKKSVLPSSVTSVLAASHHRGWVERAGEAGDDMEFRQRRLRLR